MSEFRDEDLDKFQTLVRLIERLRSPGGCPWDREQTARSLRQFTLEEAYEVVEAIDDGDTERLREELGDLLLQVVLQARIGDELGKFDIGGVIKGIVTKLIGRHRWVFGDEVAGSPEAAISSWNRIKMEERVGRPNGASLLDGVPSAMPALHKAYSLTSRASGVGFDWHGSKEVLTKMREELRELERSVESGSEREIEGEMGDLLFVIANLARHLGVNPELALERANRKFIHRFRYIEAKLAERGKSPHDADLEEMDSLWDEAKKLKG